MNEPRKMTLSQALVSCRTYQLLSIREMAKLVGLSPGGLSNLERARYLPRRTTRLRLVEFLASRGYQVEDVHVPE